MLHAAPLGVGNQEKNARVVAFFQYPGGGSHRQDATLLDVVYNLHGFAHPPVRNPLYPFVLHVRPPRQLPARTQFTPTPIFGAVRRHTLPMMRRRAARMVALGTRPSRSLAAARAPTRTVQSPPATSGFSPSAKKAATVEWISEEDLRICSKPITPVRASRIGSSIVASTSPASRAPVLCASPASLTA
jgi:hypothetical protein